MATLTEEQKLSIVMRLLKLRGASGVWYCEGGTPGIRDGLTGDVVYITWGFAQELIENVTPCRKVAASESRHNSGQNSGDETMRDLRRCG